MIIRPQVDRKQVRNATNRSTHFQLKNFDMYTWKSFSIVEFYRTSQN